jgi:phosphoribosylformylglycinamidine synthase subunit PurQ / glutaminase
MRASVVVFPGSNCDRDAAVGLQAVTGQAPNMVWHGDSDMPDCDLIVLPGGFSYGDYLRSGAMAAHSPIMRAVVEQAKCGVTVLGICNGFQVLTETGLLPGVLMRNASLKFICRDVHLRREPRTIALADAEPELDGVLTMPIAHKDGNYFADDETLDRLEGEGRVVFRYCDENGAVTPDANPNGSRRGIAGICNESGRVIGMMPHPERAIARILGGSDGLSLLKRLVATLH